MIMTKNKPLRYENIAHVGDTIKAFDFEPMLGRPDRYIIGIVVDKENAAYGYKAYVVEVLDDSGTTDAFGSRVGERVFVPFEIGLDYEGRVQNLTPEL